MAGGADIAARDDIGRTPLHFAAEGNENPAVIEALLAAGADPMARLDASTVFDGETPLHVAAYNEHPAVVEVLVAAGANVDARDEDGDTPLMKAAITGSLTVVNALLRAGADPRARGGSSSRTILHTAAAYTDDPAVIDALIAAGADLEAQDTLLFRTPLYEAVRNENPAIMGALLAAGASVEARTFDGSTVLHAAARSNNPAVIELLLAAGANVESRNEDGNTPLHMAARYVNASERTPENRRHAGDVIEALLEGGANPNARNSAGRTPWDLAQENDELQGTDAYWRLNDARFDAPRQDSRRPATTRPDGRQFASPVPQGRRGPACEVPGYPTPGNVQSLGLTWCGPTVSFQRRAFALQAAGAWCAIDIGSSSTVEQMSARHQEINAACDALEAMQAPGIPTCQCPAGYRP